MKIAMPSSLNVPSPIEKLAEAISPQKSVDPVIPVIIARPLTTKEFAAAINLQDQSVRKRVNQTGSYFGIEPKKGPNGRWQWAPNSPTQFFSGSSI